MAAAYDDFLEFEVDVDDNEEELLQQKRAEQREAIKQLTFSEDHIKSAWELFNNVLGKPKYWCAPMVGASELAFRMMVRKYGADIASTPMIHAGGYLHSLEYRNSFHFLEDSTADRPLIVQFCANNGEDFVGAAKLIENKCDAVEINLGCPQQCARSGYYGAFLMNCPEILYEIVSMAKKHLSVPILCKVRIFTDYSKTLKMCEMLQNAGCSILTVHGRTKEQKRSAETLADWNVIAQLKRDLKIPVISNGNVRDFSDVEDCLAQTQADGVMSACAILANPALFANLPEVRSFDLALEYLDFAEKYNANALQIKKHIFSILRRPLNQNLSFGKKLLLLSDDNIDFENLRDLITELQDVETERQCQHALKLAAQGGEDTAQT